MDFSSIRKPCPWCDSRRSLAPFHGHLDEPYGKCFSCGRFKPLPGDNSIFKHQKRTNLSPILAFKHREQVAQELQSLPESKLKTVQLRLRENNLVAGLMKLGIPFRHFIDWDIGHGRAGYTLFFYRNKAGLLINVKRFQYGVDLHRKGKVDFQYSKRKGYSTCLYGEAKLTRNDPALPVMLVESEKTALIASHYLKKYTWIATGGASGLSLVKAAVLVGRQVLILSDSDASGRKNTDKTQTILNGLGIRCCKLDLFPERSDGFDLADYIIEHYGSLEKLSTQNNLEL